MKLLILSLVFLSSAILAKETLRIGYIDLPPHIDTLKGEAKGPLVDFLNKHLSQKLELKFIRSSFTRVWSELKNGELKNFDSFLTLIDKEERHQYVAYFPKKLVTSTPIVCLYKAKAKNLKPQLLHVSNIPISEELKQKYKLFPMNGEDVMQRMAKMLRKGRSDGVYHPESTSLLMAMDENNLINDLSCSGFGPKNQIKLGLSHKASQKIFKILNKDFNETKENYMEYLFKKRFQENTNLKKKVLMFL
jgi:hypothetical protein